MTTRYRRVERTLCMELPTHQPNNALKYRFRSTMPWRICRFAAGRVVIVCCRMESAIRDFLLLVAVDQHVLPYAFNCIDNFHRSPYVLNTPKAIQVVHIVL